MASNAGTRSAASARSRLLRPCFPMPPSGSSCAPISTSVVAKNRRSAQSFARASGERRDGCRSECGRLACVATVSEKALSSVIGGAVCSFAEAPTSASESVSCKHVTGSGVDGEVSASALMPLLLQERRGLRGNVSPSLSDRRVGRRSASRIQ